MTLRYLKVTQPDLQREFYRARQNSSQPYSLPSLSVSTATPDLPGIRQALAATRHLLEMYRRQLSDDRIRRRLRRLDRRLLDCRSPTPEHRSDPKNEERLAGQSVAVRNSETVALRHPIIPVGNGFRGPRRRDQQPPVVIKGLPLSGLASGSAPAYRRSRHLPALYGGPRRCSFPERRNYLDSDALGLKRESDFVVKALMSLTGLIGISINPLSGYMNGCASCKAVGKYFAGSRTSVG